jgi:hypothetical protein
VVGLTVGSSVGDKVGDTEGIPVVGLFVGAAVGMHGICFSKHPTKLSSVHPGTGPTSL